MSRFLRREEGSALVTAIVLLGIMIGLGLAVHAAADTQSKQSGEQRLRESALGVTEAALQAQIFQIASKFPSQSNAYPLTCTPTSPATDPCAGSGDFPGFSGGDYATSCNGAAVVPWTTTVRDNVKLQDNTFDPFYRTAAVSAQPAHDANGDGVVWVRADGRSGCKVRSIVQQVRASETSISFPRNVVTANAFETTNRGNKVIVDTNGGSTNPAEAADVSLRCSGYANVTSPATAISSGCAKYEANKGQLSPDTLKAPAGPTPIMTTEALKTFIDLAKANRTYFPEGTCPTTLTGKAVYVGSLIGCSSLPNGGAGNSSAVPGVLIVDKGAFAIGGNREFYGVIYMRNLTNITGPVVSIQGTAAIIGAVHVDGPGSVSAGSSKANIVYDSRAGSLVTGLGGAAAVPNTWRELAPNE
jgi:Tfp pilus assembly protein PilX